MRFTVKLAINPTLWISSFLLVYQDKCNILSKAFNQIVQYDCGHELIKRCEEVKPKMLIDIHKS